MPVSWRVMWVPVILKLNRKFISNCSNCSTLKTTMKFILNLLFTEMSKFNNILQNVAQIKNKHSYFIKPNSITAFNNESVVKKEK